MIGKNLKRLMVDKGISQTSFAQQLGVSRSALIKYMDESSYMTTDKAELAAKLLGVSIAELFDDGASDIATLIRRLDKQETQINALEKLLNAIINAQKIK